MAQDGFWHECSLCKGKRVFNVLLYFNVRCEYCGGYGEFFIVDILKIKDGDAKCRVFERNANRELVYPSKVIWVDN